VEVNCSHSAGICVQRMDELQPAGWLCYWAYTAELKCCHSARSVPHFLTPSLAPRLGLWPAAATAEALFSFLRSRR